MNVYLYKRKWQFLSGRPMVLAKLLCDQFIHKTQINICSNTQFLSTQQDAHTYLLPSLIPFESLWHAG